MLLDVAERTQDAQRLPTGPRVIKKKQITLPFENAESLGVFTEVVTDCSLCKSKACCKKFDVPLTPYESTYLPLDEEKMKNGVVTLRKKEDGSCVFLTDRGCSIWTNRPLCCREYVCTGDSRLASEDVPGAVKESSE